MTTMLIVDDMNDDRQEMVNLVREFYSPVELDILERRSREGVTDVVNSGVVLQCAIVDLKISEMESNKDRISSTEHGLWALMTLVRPTFPATRIMMLTDHPAHAEKVVAAEPKLMGVDIVDKSLPELRRKEIIRKFLRAMI